MLLLVTALAGCSGDDEGPDDGQDDLPDPPTFDPLTFSDSGTILAGTETGMGCGATGQLETSSHTWTIPAEADGTAVRATEFTIVLTMGTTGFDLDLFVYDQGGALVGESTEFNVLTGDPTETVVVQPVPAGDYTITVTGCTAINASYTVTGEAALVAA